MGSIPIARSISSFGINFSTGLINSACYRQWPSIWREAGLTVGFLL
jgi:hypothetical protein